MYHSFERGRPFGQRAEWGAAARSEDRSSPRTHTQTLILLVRTEPNQTKPANKRPSDQTSDDQTTVLPKDDSNDRHSGKGVLVLVVLVVAAE